jgi:hypothetical protein
MSRISHVDIHLINISANPHPAGVYTELWERAFQARKPIAIHGERYALITSLNHIERNNVVIGLSGVLATFTDIDVDAPWLNRQTGKAVEEDDAGEIHIPEEFRPHFAEFIFYFDINNHLLAYQGKAKMRRYTGGYKNYSLSPLLFKKYMDDIFQNPMIRGDINSIVVTAVPEPSAVEDILSNPNIREINIIFEVPNSDNLATERGRVRDRLSRINAERKEEKYVAMGDDGVSPDEEMKRAARVAAMDGQVNARVTTAQGVMPVSTADKPYVRRIEINPNVEDESITIRREVKDLAKNFGMSDDG